VAINKFQPLTFANDRMAMKRPSRVSRPLHYRSRFGILIYNTKSYRLELRSWLGASFRKQCATQSNSQCI